MKELLWNPSIADLPLDVQEYFELSLEDPPNFWGHTFVVQRTHYEWEGTLERMVPADYIIDKVKTLEAAKSRYELHRQILSQMGFSHSDLDL